MMSTLRGMRLVLEWEVLGTGGTVVVMQIQPSRVVEADSPRQVPASAVLGSGSAGGPWPDDRRRDSHQVQGPAQRILEGRGSFGLVDDTRSRILLDHLRQGVGGGSRPEQNRQGGLAVAGRHEQRSR